MLKKLISLFIFVAVVSSLTFAGSAKLRGPHKNRVRVDVPTSSTVQSHSGLRVKSPHQNSPYDQTWSLIDSMPNAFGPFNTDMNPMSYDPWSNSVAFIHRGHPGYASNGGTGSMWYGYSLDNAATWTRSAQLNADGVPIFGRYPSGGISNPAHSSDPTAAIYEYSYPQLNPSAFGFICYGLDPFTAGTPFTTEYQGDVNFPYSSQTYMTVSDDGQPNVYFLVEKTDAAATATTDLAFWRTTDQGETWNEKTDWVVADHWAAIDDERIHCFGSTIYVNVAGWDIGTTDPEFFYEAKSTDNGETWSDFAKIDYRTAPELAQFEDQAADYTVAGSDGRNARDFVVDANGMEHIFFTAIDTNEANAADLMKVVEVYNTPSDGWHGNIISSRTSTFVTVLGSLDQLDNELYGTISEDRQSIAVKWVDAPAEGQTAGDIFARARKIDAGWGEKVNLTNTNEGTHQREFGTHLATRCKNADGSGMVAIFLTKMTQTADVPDDSLVAENACSEWGTMAMVSTITSVRERSNGVPNDYKLYSNYPNPFNPSTKISYDIAKGTNVTLKVYDVTGKEVATLYNGYQQAGKYEASFDASKLASGVYFSRIQAGSFSATQKMLLSK